MTGSWALVLGGGGLAGQTAGLTPALAARTETARREVSAGRLPGHCAVPGVWPPVTIDGARYIDGGVRTSTNADLADGFERGKRRDDPGGFWS